MLKRNGARQARNQGGEAPLEKFPPLGKMCWTSFKTIEHSSQILEPSQKTLHPSWCPTLVAGLAPGQIPVGRRSIGVITSPFAVSVVNGKAAIANHLHDHVDHVSVRRQSQQLAGEAAMPYIIVGCCEIAKHNSGLHFGQKAIPDVLCQQVDLVYARPPVGSPPAFVGAVG